MNGPIHHPLRQARLSPGGTTPRTPRLSARWQKAPLYRALGAGVALSGLALAGCGVAPAGATVNSAAVGPVRTGDSARNFAPFPVPALWSGQDNVTYTMVVKAKTGTAPRGFGFTAKPSMVFWLNCLGNGSVHLTSAAIGLKWGMKCGNGEDPSALTFTPPRAAQGKKAVALVTASAGARWEVRIDEAAPGLGPAE